MILPSVTSQSVDFSMIILISTFCKVMHSNVMLHLVPDPARMPIVVCRSFRRFEGWPRRRVIDSSDQHRQHALQW